MFEDENLDQLNIKTIPLFEFDCLKENAFSLTLG